MIVAACVQCLHEAGAGKQMESSWFDIGAQCRANLNPSEPKA